jgi:hypothetical protein
MQNVALKIYSDLLCDIKNGIDPGNHDMMESIVYKLNIVRQLLPGELISNLENMLANILIGV